MKDSPYKIHFRCTRCNAVIYADFKKMVEILNDEGYDVIKKEDTNAKDETEST